MMMRMMMIKNEQNFTLIQFDHQIENLKIEKEGDRKVVKNYD